jgi:mannose-6-phosphate isomerase-like protein (cupin superfamily)
MSKSSESENIPKDYDYIAPDGSEIRLLTSVPGNSFCHCTLPIGKTSQAITHKTIDEIWHFLSGEGEVWRKLENVESVTKVQTDVTIKIPCGTQFQFRNTGKSPLQFLISTTPPWPNDDEAIIVPNHWNIK